MTCPKCQNPISIGQLFCTYCGNGLNTFTSSTPFPSPPKTSSTNFFQRHWKFFTVIIVILMIFLIPPILFVNLLKDLSTEINNQEAKQAIISGSGTDKIALVNIDGMIVEKEPSKGIGVVSSEITSERKLKKTLQDVAADEKVKALILRVDSPGGSAVASEDMLQDIKDYKKKTGNKIIAYFSDLAASGGFYVSMDSDYIVANPSTITGSIGVIVEYLNFTDIAQKYGIKNIVFKSGSHKDILSEFRDPTDEEKNILQGIVNDSYANFVKAVSDGRKIPEDQVRKIADGRIYSASQAASLKLVDELGNFEKAISITKKLSGLKDAKVVEFGSQSPLESLLNSYLPNISLSLLPTSHDLFGSKAGPSILYLYAP